MKKNILLLLGALLLVNTSAIANTDKAFYLKARMGGNKISGIKTTDHDINFKVIQNSKISQTNSVGIGYYIDSTTRVDLTFENARLSFIPKKSNFSFADDTGMNYGNKLIKRNANIQTIMLNTYFDIFSKGSFKAFVGGGLGTSTIKEKIIDELKMDDVVINGHTISIPSVITNNNKKARNSLAYALIIGSDIDLMKNLHIELAYSWKHYGKVKSCNNRYEGHNMSAAIRFDL